MASCGQCSGSLEVEARAYVRGWRSERSGSAGVPPGARAEMRRLVVVLRLQQVHRRSEAAWPAIACHREEAETPDPMCGKGAGRGGAVGRRSRRSIGWSPLHGPPCANGSRRESGRAAVLRAGERRVAGLRRAGSRARAGLVPGARRGRRGGVLVQVAGVLSVVWGQALVGLGGVAGRPSDPGGDAGAAMRAVAAVSAACMESARKEPSGGAAASSQQSVGMVLTGWARVHTLAQEPITVWPWTRLIRDGFPGSAHRLHQRR